MKFITDENIGLEIVEFLRSCGHDVYSVTEKSRGVNDVIVLQKALENNRLIITCDTDFGELVYHQKFAHCGVILLRLDDETNANKIKVLSNLLKIHKTKLANKFTVVTETKVRVRSVHNPR